MTNNESGLFNVRLIQSKITIGNGKHLIAEKVGDLRVSYNYHGQTKVVILHNVKYAPDLCVNLLSIPTALSNGFTIGNHGMNLFLSKGTHVIKFDKLFSNSKNSVCGIELFPIATEMAHPALEPGTTLKMEKIHHLLGHCGEDSTRATAKYYGWNATGIFKPCEDCGVGKAKQASVSKLLSTKSTIPGERWFIDISSVKAESYGGTKFWFGMLDDCTDLFLSHCLRTKKSLGETLVMTLQTLQIKYKKTPKYICCDDAPENHKAEEACIKAGISVQFEYTPPGTPQRNGRIERKFATFYGRMRSTFKSAGLQDDDIKYGVWAECATTISALDNILVSGTQKESPYFKFYGKHPPYATKL